MTGLAGVLAVIFVAFAITGDRRERRCLDRVPELGYALPEKQIERGRQREACQAGKPLGLSEPF